MPIGAQYESGLVDNIAESDNAEDILNDNYDGSENGKNEASGVLSNEDNTNNNNNEHANTSTNTGKVIDINDIIRDIQD